VDQEFAVFRLNLNVRLTAPTPSTEALIAGWYNNNTTTTQNKNYLPPDWAALNSPIATATYHNVVARSCRTCHAALPAYDWDKRPTDLVAFASRVCGGSPNKFLNHAMPNSLVTFNRFWGSEGTANDQPLQFKSYMAFLGNNLSSGCSASLGP
jgi:hypothetical protein